MCQGARCDSICSISQGQGHAFRVGSVSESLSEDRSNLALSRERHVCHILELQDSQYVSPIPDQRAWKMDALGIPWDNLNGYAFCPVAILPQLVQKM